MDAKQVADRLAFLEGRVQELEDVAGQDYVFVWSEIKRMYNDLSAVKSTLAKLEGQARFEDVFKSAVKPAKSRKVLIFGAGVVLGMGLVALAYEDKQRARENLDHALGKNQNGE